MQQLDTVQANLDAAQTEACGQCALCFLNGEDCDKCTVADDGCPGAAYNKMTSMLSLLKVE